MTEIIYPTLILVVSILLAVIAAVYRVPIARFLRHQIFRLPDDNTTLNAEAGLPGLQYDLPKYSPRTLENECSLAKGSNGVVGHVIVMDSDDTLIRIPPPAYRATHFSGSALR